MRDHLNRNVWLILGGFHQDLRNFTEIANVVKSFGKLITWDKFKSTRATIIVKVRVEDLSFIPTSIIQSNVDDFLGESWAVLVVILQQELLGGGPPDEVPVPLRKTHTQCQMWDILTITKIWWWVLWLCTCL